MTTTEPCRACGEPTERFADGSVLGDQPVSYRRCPSCGLVLATEPTWLDRAYGTAIARLDIGPLERCWLMSHVTATVLLSERARRGRFLDWAGGYGILARMMRDRGFDFSHHDPMATNIFAEGHQVDDLAGQRFDLITGFEVLEHLQHPVTELAPLARATDRMLLSTVVLPDPAPLPGQWWYYTPETGQHITFYTPAALRALAGRLGFDGVVTGSLVHLFYRGRRPNRLTRAIIAKPQLGIGAGQLSWVLERRHSLQATDLEAIRSELGYGSPAETGGTQR